MQNTKEASRMTGKGQALMPKYKVETQKLKKNFNQEEQSIT